jgi:hypothetical protein
MSSMHRKTENFDEYILAAYLSGDVPDRLRQEIASYLNCNPGARELLGMATDALDAAETGDGASYYPVGPEIAGRQRAPDSEWSDTVPSSTIFKTATAICLAVVVLAIALLVHLYGTTGTTKTNSVPVTDTTWVPLLEVSSLGIVWSQHSDAILYRVYIANSSDQREVLSIETESFSIPASQIAHLPAGKYQVWIEANDSSGRIVSVSSRSDVLLTPKSSD